MESVRHLLNFLDRDALVILADKRALAASRSNEERRSRIARSYRGDVVAFLQDLRREDLLELVRDDVVWADSEYFLPNAARYSKEDLLRFAEGVFVHDGPLPPEYELVPGGGDGDDDDLESENDDEDEEAEESDIDVDEEGDEDEADDEDEAGDDEDDGDEPSLLGASIEIVAGGSVRSGAPAARDRGSDTASSGTCAGGQCKTSRRHGHRGPSEGAHPEPRGRGRDPLLRRGHAGRGPGRPQRPHEVRAGAQANRR
jgi:hypothetical protein